MKWVKASEGLPELKDETTYDDENERGILFVNRKHSACLFVYPSITKDLKSLLESYPDAPNWEWLDETESTATQALKQIEQFSDCGDYAMAIVRMKAIASEALKSESIPSEVEEDIEKMAEEYVKKAYLWLQQDMSEIEQSKLELAFKAGYRAAKPQNTF
jgi:hypothetical protein